MQHANAYSDRKPLASVPTLEKLNSYAYRAEVQRKHGTFEPGPQTQTQRQGVGRKKNTNSTANIDEVGR